MGRSKTYLFLDYRWGADTRCWSWQSIVLSGRCLRKCIYWKVRRHRRISARRRQRIGNVDVFTIGYRYYPFMHSRDGLAWHQEFATENFKGLASSGRDQRFSSYFMGFDFAF